jgi:hypothetical protein
MSIDTHMPQYTKVKILTSVKTDENEDIFTCISNYFKYAYASIYKKFSKYSPVKVIGMLDGADLDNVPKLISKLSEHKLSLCIYNVIQNGKYYSININESLKLGASTESYIPIAHFANKRCNLLLETDEISLRLNPVFNTNGKKIIVFPFQTPKTIMRPRVPSSFMFGQKKSDSDTDSYADSERQISKIIEGEEKEDVYVKPILSKQDIKNTLNEIEKLNKVIQQENENVEDKQKEHIQYCYRLEQLNERISSLDSERQYFENIISRLTKELDYERTKRNSIGEDITKKIESINTQKKKDEWELDNAKYKLLAAKRTITTAPQNWGSVSSPSQIHHHNMYGYAMSESQTLPIEILKYMMNISSYDSEIAELNTQLRTNQDGQYGNIAALFKRINVAKQSIIDNDVEKSNVMKQIDDVNDNISEIHAHEQLYTTMIKRDELRRDELYNMILSKLDD